MAEEQYIAVEIRGVSFEVGFLSSALPIPLAVMVFRAFDGTCQGWSACGVCIATDVTQHHDEHASARALVSSLKGKLQRLWCSTYWIGSSNSNGSYTHAHTIGDSHEHLTFKDLCSTAALPTRLCSRLLEDSIVVWEDEVSATYTRKRERQLHTAPQRACPPHCGRRSSASPWPNGTGKGHTELAGSDKTLGCRCGCRKWGSLAPGRWRGPGGGTTR